MPNVDAAQAAPRCPAWARSFSMCALAGTLALTAVPTEAQAQEELGANDAPADVDEADDEAESEAPAGSKEVSDSGTSADVAPAAAPVAEAGPFYERRAPAPQREDALRPLRGPVRARRKINVPMTVAGGVITSLGAMAFGGGLIGFFASIDCQSGWIFPTCQSTPEWLWVTVAGAAAAGGIGTPLLVSGLRRKVDEVPQASAVSFSVGPASGALWVSF